MQNNEIAAIFDKVAILLRISEDNEFHARAYENAARIVRGSGESFTQMVEGEIDLAEKYRGIGKGISDHIKEIVQTGKLKKLEKLSQKVPLTLIEITKIRGVGPKTVNRIWKKADITTVDQLETAAKNGGLRTIGGIGKKTEQNILEGIQKYRNWKNRLLLSDADAIAEDLTEFLKRNAKIQQFEMVGSYRRRKDTVGDLDVLVTATSAPEVMKYFTTWNRIEKVDSAGKTKASAVLKNNFRVDLRIIEPKNFGAALLYFTGSKAHNIHLRSLALVENFTLSEYGVFKKPTGISSSEARKEENWIAGRDEAEIYTLLDMDWIPPELREDRGEITASKNHALPKLISFDQIQGDLQMHTSYTDGNNTIEEMIQQAIELGYAYIAITDHSKSMAMTGGMDERKLDKQIQKIDSLNEIYKNITVLKGMEVDIKKDGTLDLSNSVLDKLDVVLASIHTHLTLPISEQTQRVIKAIDGTPVNILSHPTNRIINERNPSEIEFEKIFEVAQKNQVAIECNAQPHRLDLNAINLKRSKEYKVKIAINTDAHTRGQLRYMKYGINQARRGWIESQDVINSWDIAKLKQFLRKK
ncbi:MAG: DNA polymerase/3'-5' exonuclease PolX [Candidatus Lokiarchaeota archaeon]|nr:DNA polymerase/3'-5' exonuclease PolX [Candidatus Lokiarchaeota archaeon]